MKSVCYNLNESDLQKESYKLASAVMAYLILGGFEIEPNIAIYEKASQSSHLEVLEELKAFRVADNIAPQHYVNIALGRESEVPKSDLDKIKSQLNGESELSQQEDFTKLLNTWKYQYLFLLKATHLWRLKDTDLEKAKSFIHWMMNEAYFSSVSFIFTLLFLAPTRMPKMIKNINSSDYKRLISGIKNASWDCTYVKHWQSTLAKTPPSTIQFLCSNDKIVRKLSRLLFANQDQSSEQTLLENFQETWGEFPGKKLYELYAIARLEVANNREHRKSHIKGFLSKIDQMILSLENELKNQK